MSIDRRPNKSLYAWLVRHEGLDVLKDEIK